MELSQSFSLTVDKGRLAIMLFGLDAALIGVHGLWGLAVAFDHSAGIPALVDIEKRHSLANFFGYLKWAIAAAFFWMAWRFGRRPGSLALVGVTGLIFIDDSFGLHEALGGPAAQLLGFGGMPASTAQDVGEVIIFLCMGLLALAAIGLAALGEDREGRRMLRGFIVLLAALAIFGVAGDFIHASINYSAGATHRLMHRLAGMLEDGGELVMASAIVLFASAALRRERAAKARRRGPEVNARTREPATGAG